MGTDFKTCGVLYEPLPEYNVPKSSAVNRQPDVVNHPSHYPSNASGLECIDVVENMTFNLGNAIKYIWRAGRKGDAVTDLAKAIWYCQREIERIKKEASK